MHPLESKFFQFLSDVYMSLTLTWWSLEPLKTTSCPLPSLSTVRHMTGPKWPVSFPVDTNLVRKQEKGDELRSVRGDLWFWSVFALTCGDPTSARRCQQQRRGRSWTGWGQSGWSGSPPVGWTGSWPMWRPLLRSPGLKTWWHPHKEEVRTLTNSDCNEIGY